MRLSEECAIVPLIESANFGSVGVDSDSVNLAKVHGLTAAFLFGAITGNSILTAWLGATAGAKTTAIAFTYRLGAADAGTASADQLGDPVAVAASGLTLVAATFDHREVIIEVDSDAVVLEGKPWLTFSIDSTATILNVACLGVGHSRQRQHLMPSVL
jgi:hypothetical protein